MTTVLGFNPTAEETIIQSGVAERHHPNPISEDLANPLIAEQVAGANRLGVLALWLSVLSELIYFFTSHGIRNHVLFIVSAFRRAFFQ